MFGLFCLICWRDRELKLRIKEHKENLSKELPTSPIYKHLEETGHHDFDWDSAIIKGTFK